VRFILLFGEEALNLKLSTRLQKKLWLSDALLVQTIIGNRSLKNLRGGLIFNLLSSIVSKLTNLAYRCRSTRLRISHGHTVLLLPADKEPMGGFDACFTTLWQKRSKMSKSNSSCRTHRDIVWWVPDTSDIRSTQESLEQTQIWTLAYITHAGERKKKRMAVLNQNKKTPQYLLTTPKIEIFQTNELIGQGTGNQPICPCLGFKSTFSTFRRIDGTLRNLGYGFEWLSRLRLTLAGLWWCFLQDALALLRFPLRSHWPLVND